MSATEIKRKVTKTVRCGDVLIGGGNPISIQSMTNTDTRDVRATLEQIARLKDAGCDIVRLAVPDAEAAEAFGEIKKQAKVPLVADIHFDYRLAIAAIKNGADKVRINPGNIGSAERVRAVVDAAKERGIPIRVGVNSGSLEKDIVQRDGGVTAAGIAESAMRSVRLLEDMDFGDIVVSIKSSDIVMNTEAHRIISGLTDHPLHIGLTESGGNERGRIKSAIGIGSILAEGIGDTMRVSLTGDPVQEPVLAREILRALGLLKGSVNLVSCPTCARTKVDLAKIVGEIEAGLGPLEEERRKRGLANITVAVMGCAVNGPGEAAEADFGVACGDGKGLLFSGGKILETVPAEDISKIILRKVKEYESL